MLVAIAITEICENFNCLAITAHEIQTGDRHIDVRTDRRTVLVIGSRFYPLRNPKKRIVIPDSRDLLQLFDIFMESERQCV